MLVVARYAEISFLSALLSHGPISVYVWEWAFYEANIMSNQMKVREICKKSRKKNILDKYFYFAKCYSRRYFDTF